MGPRIAMASRAGLVTNWSQTGGQRGMAGEKPNSQLRARAGLGVVGVAAFVASWIAAGEVEQYALGLVGFGGFCIVLALILPWLKRGKGGPLEFEFQQEAEKVAAAEAADVGLPPADVEKKIESDVEEAPTASPEDADVIGTLNYVAGSMALQAIFDWTTAEGEPLEGCSMRLYLLDEEEEPPLLKAVLAPPEVERATAWGIGQGATGAAFESGEYVLATGPAVSDATYGLTDAQQDRFRQLAAVAAAPVFNAASARIGVVTVSTSNLDHNLDSEEARRDHTLAALLVSRVLVELLQWFGDNEP